MRPTSLSSFGLCDVVTSVEKLTCRGLFIGIDGGDRAVLRVRMLSRLRCSLEPSGAFLCNTVLDGGDNCRDEMVAVCNRLYDDQLEGT